MSYLYHTTLERTLRMIQKDGLKPRVCPGHGLTPYTFLTVEGEDGYEEGVEYWFAAAESVAEQEETRAIVLRVERDDVPSRLFRDEPGTRAARSACFKVKKTIPPDRLEWSYSPAGPWRPLK